MDAKLVRTVEAEAKRREKALPRMVGVHSDSLASTGRESLGLRPVTASLVGIVKDSRLFEADYLGHLKEEHS